jgi:hypothetical protein
MKTDESAKIDQQSWDAESAKVRHIPNPVILLMTAVSAPATLLVLGSLLFYIFTKPIRPYAGGEWLMVDLGAFVLLGVFAGLVSRGLRGFAGIVLGMTGAVALQLFVLTGQASWTPSVATALSGSSWLPTVATSLGLGLAALVVGYTPTRVAGHILAPRPGDQVTPSGHSWRYFAPSIIVAVIGILVCGLLLVDASTTAYVHPVALQQITGKNSIVQGIGGLLAVLIAGWAASGTVIEARRPRRSPGRELFAGLATALPLGWLALVAIDLTHNVF